MSGPLHAIMRGQYAQSFQSADERARNRAAAAVVLGTVLIGGAIYVVTKYGNLSMMQFSDANSVTTKERERIEGYLQQIDELEAKLSSKTESSNKHEQQASYLENKLAVALADLQTKSTALDAAIREGADHLARATRDSNRSWNVSSLVSICRPRSPSVVSRSSLT